MFTFDDGPNEHANVTLNVLSILKQYNIRAYFCVIGSQAIKNPEMLKKIYEAGHIIANHSYHHDIKIFFFHFDSEYTTRNYKHVVRKMIRSLEQDQGGKFVLHDGGVRLFTPSEEDYLKPDKEVNRTRVSDALEEIIRHFSEQGYTFDIDS